jgi:nucleoside-diphosphate-sugar epimerase
MKDILVIGGSRFIGLHVVMKLMEKDYNVTVFNRGHHNDNLPKGLNTIVGDRKDEEHIKTLFDENNYDVVIDMCGFIPKDVERIANHAKGKIKQYLFCSTVSVYDFEQALTLPIKESYPLNRQIVENDNPYANYGSNKALCEDELLSNGDFPVTIFRPTFVYGPYDTIYRTAYFYDRIDDNRPIIFDCGGYNVLHWVYVKDLADAFVSSIGKESSYGHAYNIASAEYLTLANFILLCGKASGKDVNLKPVENYNQIIRELFTEEETSNPRSPLFPFPSRFSFTFDISKAMEELDWLPKYSMLKGLKETYLWYETHGKPDSVDYSKEDRILAYLDKS